MQQKTFWMHREQQEYPILRGRHSADAAVVGGGVTGLMTALWLSRAGLRVALVEAVRLGSGASGCCAGVVSLCGGLRYARVEKQLGAGAAGAWRDGTRAVLAAGIGHCPHMCFRLVYDAQARIWECPAMDRDLISDAC